MSRFVLSVPTLAFLAGASAAADLPQTFVSPVLTAPTLIAFNWTGFYFGAHGGYGFGKAPFVDGAVAGGQVGVNWQRDAFVIGVEGDGSWVDWTGADAVGTIRLRGGFAFDRFFVYATGGAAFHSFDDVGWVVGTGAEFAITRNWTIGAEYIYFDLDPGTADDFRVRASYHFGVPGAFGFLNSGGPMPAAMTSPTPLAFNWTGFYAGAHGGYSLPDGAGLNDSYEIGGQVGVNRQFGQVVLGIEADGGAVDWGPVTAVGSVRGRLGYALDRFLPYVTGGMGIEDAIGWSLGAGVDYAITDRWSIGVDYLHGDFIGGHTADMVRGRVNYLFNAVSGI
jgi:outer membrane immunogenic protein